LGRARDDLIRVLDFPRPRGTLSVVLAFAVLVALALLAVAVSWGHVPQEARPPAEPDDPTVPRHRAA
jgi:hypothetical protein